MAGRGPAPNEHGRQRPRDEKPAADVLPAEGNTEPFPPLPRSWRKEYVVWERDPETREKYAVEKVKQVRYLPITREWYEEFATSPMAVRFTKVDWSRLRLILAPLRDQFHRGNHALAGEIRLQETRLGATVRDRQEMRVKIAKPPAAKRPAAPAADGEATNVTSLSDRKARMRSGAASTG
jgi:hypothetical protein